MLDPPIRIPSDLGRGVILPPHGVPHRTALWPALGEPAVPLDPTLGDDVGPRPLVDGAHGPVESLVCVGSDLVWFVGCVLK